MYVCTCGHACVVCSQVYVCMCAHMWFAFTCVLVCVVDFRLFLLMVSTLPLRQTLSLRYMGYREPARLGFHGLEGSVVSTPPALVWRKDAIPRLYVGAAG